MRRPVLITLGAMAATFVLGIAALATQNIMLLGTLAVVPLLVLLVAQPDILLVCIIAVYESSLTLPGLPPLLNLFYLLAGLFVVVGIVSNLIAPESHRRMALSWLVWAFALVLLVTASIRGFGLRFTGSQTWGGATYVQLLVAVSLLLTAQRTGLSLRQWRLALGTLCVLSIIPVVAGLMFAFSGGSVWQQYFFVVPSFGERYFLMELTRGSEMARLQVANVASTYLFTLALLLWKRPKRRVPAILLLGASFILMGISGHRIAAVFNVFLAFFYAFTDPRRNPISRIVNRVTVSGVLLLFCLALTARHLPLTFQRTLAWVPFADISEQAKADASTTSLWRLDLWKRVVREVPRYLLLGKGFAFSSEDLMVASLASQQMYSMELFMAAHNYHNGVLALLMDLGLPGLLTGGGILALAIRIHWRRTMDRWHSPELGHYHRVFLASFMANVAANLLISGALATFVTLFLWILIMEGLARTDERLAAAAAAVKPAEEPTPALQHEAANA